MMAEHRTKRAVAPLLGRVILASLGLAFALGAVEMLMRAFPNWIPAEVRVNPPARRVRAFIDETYDLRLSDGDLFHYMRGHISPLSPDQDRVLAHVHMITDAYGFRNAPPEKATYDIVALGDSFTRASGVASPWTQELAEQAGIDVLNLGDVAFGPQDELKVLRQYGLKKQPRWVIMAYFEGNDLYDAASYEQANPFILLRFGRYILDEGLEPWQRGDSSNAQAAASPAYRYPITLTIKHKDLEMAFFSYYISWLSLRKEVIAASQNYRLVKETILHVQELSDATGAQFVLVYLPSKSHVYLPYLDDAETVAQIFSGVPMLKLDEAGFIQFTGREATPELTQQYMDDQAWLLAAFAAEHNIRFLDLTPVFQEQAGTGAELYYPFDTHWTQLGHDLAAKTIYNYMKEMLADAASQTAGNSR
jgi:hypothetical protein